MKRPNAEPEGFPWDEVMAFGLGVLGLSPHDFWTSTPREIMFAMRAHQAGTSNPTDRKTLQQLMMKFPDRADAKNRSE